MNVAIVGCRWFNDPQVFVEALLDDAPKFSLILTGDCKGTDRMVRDILSKWYCVRVFEADWLHHGLSAGPRRNARIVANADYVIAFWDGKSRGTRNTIELAHKKGIPVRVVRI